MTRLEDWCDDHLRAIAKIYRIAAWFCFVLFFYDAVFAMPAVAFSYAVIVLQRDLILTPQ